MTGARQVICFVVSFTFVSLLTCFCKIDRVVLSMKYYPVAGVLSLTQHPKFVGSLGLFHKKTLLAETVVIL